MRPITLWPIARALLVAHILFAFVTWLNLPARVPTHFGLAGQADAWSEGSSLGWFVLVAVSFGLQVMMQLLTQPGARGLWNMPEKERFLSLTFEQQAPVLQLMRAFGGLSAICVSTTMFCLHIGVYLAARGITQGLPWYLLVAMLAPTACMLAALIPWSKKVKEAVFQAGNNQ